MEKYNEGIFEGIFLLEKYNEGSVEGRRYTGMDCIMSQDFGQTITQLQDQKVDVTAFHSKDWLKHNFKLI